MLPRNLPPDSAEILHEAAGIAAAPGTSAERAELLLALVQRLVPSEAGFVALLSPEEQAHVPLARHGYGERIDGYLDGPAFLADLERGGQRRTRRAVQHTDALVPQTELPVWAEYLLPAGFRGALGVALFTSDRRYLGLVGVTTERATATGQDVCDMVELLAEHVAHAVDPLRSLATIAGIVHAASAGVVLARSGAPLPLPGLSGHRLLAAGSAVLTTAAAQLSEGGPYTSFLVPLPAAQHDGAGNGDTHARIAVLAVPLEVRAFATAVVLVSPAGDLHGLSRRELQVLGWLVTGATNERIGQALGITARTVELHVDHVRTKLAVGTRTAAAARALRLGLFVPSSLDVRA